MAEEQPLSKRERQKQRRDQKRQHQRAEARRQRATRLVVLGVIAALVLGGTGVAVAGWLANRAADAELRAQALARLDELGCTEDETQPDLGAGHISDNLAEFAPDRIYPNRPTSSGVHLPRWILTGVYDKEIDERLLVHNLEHGYVVVYHDAGADPEAVAELEANAEERIGSGAPKLIVTPWIGELPEEANFAFVAWRQRQLCEQYDEGVLLEFLTNHHGLRGQAPEKDLQAHLNPGEGLDPNDTEGPLLFPPLGQSDGAGGPSMSEDDGAAPTGTASPTDGATPGGPPQPDPTEPAPTEDGA